MAISFKAEQEIVRAEMLHKELGLGYHKSFVSFVGDGKDGMGTFICLVMKQYDTNVSTERYTEGEKTTRYKDIAKVHIGDNRMNKNGVASVFGSELDRFLKTIYAQKPELKKLSWVETINALEGKSIDVWYSRNKDGYLNVSFSEGQYQYAINHGYTGSDEPSEPVEGKELNEDCPF